MAYSPSSGTIAGRLGHGEGTPPGADCVHLLAHGAGLHDGGADAVKLLFFTVELERTERVDDLVGLESRGGRAPHDPPSGRVVICIAAALGVFAAGVAGWLISGGGLDFTSDLPSWLPMSLAARSAGAGSIVQLNVTSAPDNATVLVDGRERGKTPVSVAVAKGPHTLLLTHPIAVDAERQLSISRDVPVNVTMFERRPHAVQLKPAYPGASINDARFLDDGRVTLTMGLPGEAADISHSGTGILNEAWIYDPASELLAPFATPSSNPRAAIVVLSPDGNRVAYAQPPQTAVKPGKRLTDVVVAGSDAALRTPVFALPPSDAVSANASATSGEVEEIRDLTWAPDSRHLLVVVRLVRVGGGPPSASRSRILLIDAVPANGQALPPLELLTLPAEIVPGSYSWAPDGNWVAFLTTARNGSGNTDFTALCALDISAAGDVSGFRYVADLGKQSDSAGTLPVADLAWSSAGDGRLLYTAPTPRFTVSNPLGLPTTSGGAPGLFSAMPAAPALTAEEGQRFGSATGMFAPTWIGVDDAGGQKLIALSRSDKGSKPLVIEGIDAVGGVPQNLGILLPTGVGGDGTVAARWDVRHGRLLLLARRGDSSTGLDYWMVQVLAQGSKP